MKHSTTYYFIQSVIEGNAPEIVGHGKDEETGEIFYKFLDKKKAKDLIVAEKKISPQYKYRLVKEVSNFDFGEWE